MKAWNDEYTGKFLKRRLRTLFFTQPQDAGAPNPYYFRAFRG